MKGCFACKKGGRIGYLYGGGRREAIEARIEILPGVVDEENLSARREELRGVRGDLLRLGHAGADGGAGGGVLPQPAGDLLRGGVRALLCGAVPPPRGHGALGLAGDAEPVAQFASSIILLANKGAHLALRAYRKEGYEAGKHLVEHVFPGTCDTPVGILGAGASARA